MLTLDTQWLANGPNGEGYKHHFNAALNLIKLSGPESFQPPVARQIYTTIRSIAVSHKAAPFSY
jgi:hypothetical protein